MYDVASFETTCQLHVGRGNTKHRHRATRPTTLTRRLSGDNLHQRPLQPYISQICCWGLQSSHFSVRIRTFHGTGSRFPKFCSVPSPDSFTQFQALNDQKTRFGAKLQRSRALFHWFCCSPRKENLPRYSLIVHIMYVVVKVDVLEVEAFV
jgi:hypothetical protein